MRKVYPLFVTVKIFFNYPFKVVKHVLTLIT